MQLAQMDLLDRRVHQVYLEEQAVMAARVNGETKEKLAGVEQTVKMVARALMEVMAAEDLLAPKEARVNLVMMEVTARLVALVTGVHVVIKER